MKSSKTRLSVSIIAGLWMAIVIAYGLQNPSEKNFLGEEITCSSSSSSSCGE
jgi:hypothetical protein